MRLIDADALLEKWNKDCTDGNCFGDCWECQFPTAIEELQNAPTIPAPRWHRVEEPPKEHGKYPVCWVENGNFYWEEAHYCYYQDGDKWIAWSSFQGDDVEITPDYWMPIEPPKEDA